MKQKAHICLFLCAVMVFSLLAGCGEDKNSDSPLSSTDGITSANNFPFFSAGRDKTEDSDSTGSSDTSDKPDVPDFPDITDIFNIPDTPAPIDPNSKLLPDLEDFLLRSASTRKDFNSTGRKLEWNGSHPIVSYESTKQELLDLLLEPQYQLCLRESKTNPHYSDTITDIFFDYTGTNPDITLVADEHEENTFHVRLRVTPYFDNGFYRISIVYSNGFELSSPGSHVSRDITPNGDSCLLDPMDQNSPPDDSNSTLIPCLEEFLYRERTKKADHYAYGDPYGKEESFQYLPLAAYEAVKAELLELFTCPLYQLKLTDSRDNPYYDRTAQDYYFSYTGTNPDITPITDKYEQKYTFDVMLRFIPDSNTGTFHIYLFYNQNFEHIYAATHTKYDVTRDGDGSILEAPPQSSTGGSGKERCGMCHGSGKCTHCGGDDKVKKFQAGLGWVELNCTFCTSGRCRYCNGKGEK